MNRSLAPEIELQRAVNGYLLSTGPMAAAALESVLDEPAAPAELSGPHQALALTARACLVTPSAARRAELEAALAASVSATAAAAKAAYRGTDDPAAPVPAYPWQRRADLA